MEELLRSFDFLEVTWEIAALKRDYPRRGITLALTDATIAAVALTHHLTLITDNAKHYPMKDLQRYALG